MLYLATVYSGLRVHECFQLGVAHNLALQVGYSITLLFAGSRVSLAVPPRFCRLSLGFVGYSASHWQVGLS